MLVAHRGLATARLCTDVPPQCRLGAAAELLRLGVLLLQPRRGTLEEARLLLQQRAHRRRGELRRTRRGARSQRGGLCGGGLELGNVPEQQPRLAQVRLRVRVRGWLGLGLG